MKNVYDHFPPSDNTEPKNVQMLEIIKIELFSMGKFKDKWELELLVCPWFDLARHKIREGKAAEIIKKLKESEEKELWSELSDDARKVLKNLIVYLETHKEHMVYDKFEAIGLPIGSGMVESTCKWLIQQRFKGVGMRWSEEGFCRLLHLRIAWVNEEFDVLFSSSPN